MSRYFTVHRHSRTYSGTDEFRTLLGVLLYVCKTYRIARSRKALASEYTLEIKEHDHYERVERREYERLRKIYGRKDK